MSLTLKQKQKSISLALIKEIEKYQRSLQRRENIRFGRKAKSISFVKATMSPKRLARFILEGEK
tara:strand:- start:1014 stop:1205 length:192 start_codon:yes stop_codon:yes gene_type:complete